MALKVGDVIPISASALSDISLVTDRGETVFRGRLGQAKGKKAISLVSKEIGVGWGRDKSPRIANDTLAELAAGVEFTAPGDAGGDDRLTPVADDPA